MSADSDYASSYLRYLPAVYATSEPEFLYGYLKIFQKILTGVDDTSLEGRRGIQELLAADVIGNLFYPRLSFLFDPDNTEFIPPISGAKADVEQAILTDLNRYIGVADRPDPLAQYVAQSIAAPNLSGITAWLNDFLAWLALWVDLPVDNAWSIDKKRNVMAQILALYRQRGTLAGMAMLCNLWLDLPLKVTGISYDAQGDSKIEGEIKLLFSNPQPPNIVCTDDVSKAFVLQANYQSSYTPGPAVLGGYLPWLFQVQIVLPNQRDPKFYRAASANAVRQSYAAAGSHQTRRQLFSDFYCAQHAIAAARLRQQSWQQHFIR
jgi:Phage tail protein (Tail_P2_I)